jgi:hypothetical protein
LNHELITGLGQVTDIAVSGGFLYVSGLLPNFRGAVSKYATSGRLVNRFLITGEPGGIAVSGDPNQLVNWLGPIPRMRSRSYKRLIDWIRIRVCCVGNAFAACSGQITATVWAMLA